jgi:bifunctional UDP-N-acetylglucosamine pyrophosphorylase/glucosamine-1-phosphate N-acetyltransferase
MKITAVLLAAGQGTRMKSNLPKMLHPICGQPMVFYALKAAQAASTETPLVVIGHGADAMRKAIGPLANIAVQEQQLGTGHAVLQAEPALKGQTDYVLVTCGDMPLLRVETLQKLVAAQQANQGPISMLTVIHDYPRGFGRILRNPDGSVAAIVEESQASPDQLLIKELNVAAYCFEARWLWDSLHRIQLSPKGEYFLTDTVALAASAGLPVQAFVMDDFGETIGVNTRVHLAEAEAAMRRRINERHMLAGVSMIDPGSTYIEESVTISQDTVIWPNTYLFGKTSIGENCQIGPNTHLRDMRIGNGCKVFMSVAESAVLEDHVDMGPFARLRKGAYLSNGVHMGNSRGGIGDSHSGSLGVRGEDSHSVIGNIRGGGCGGDSRGGGCG